MVNTSHWSGRASAGVHDWQAEPHDRGSVAPAVGQRRLVIRCRGRLLSKSRTMRESVTKTPGLRT